MISGLQFDPPDLTEEVAVRVAEEVFGVTGHPTILRGERTHNTWLSATGGDDLVLRVASLAEPDDTVDFHVRALVHIAERSPELPVARIVPALTGELSPVVQIGDGAHRVRLETFLPGVTFDDDQIVSPEGLVAIGELLGSVAAALDGFDHPASRRFMPWNIADGIVVDAEVIAAAEPDARRLVNAAASQVDGAMRSLRSLPHQVIHNDGHNGNLVRADATSEVVTGLIDFGDLVWTATVADVAVAAASLAAHRDDAVEALGSLTAGYATGLAASRSLVDAELDAISDLVLCRLVLRTLLTDYQIANAPHIADEVAAERPGVLAGLERWLDVERAEATSVIRDAAKMGVSR